MSSIIIITDSYLPTIGGAELMIKDLINYLTKHSYDIILITPPDFDNNPKCKNIKSAFVTANPIRLLRESIKIYKIIKDLDILLINSHHIYPPGGVGLILSRLMGKPNIVTAHGSDIQSSKKMKFGIFSLRKKIGFFIFAHLSTKLILGSEKLVKITNKYKIPISKIEIIPPIINWLDLDKNLPKKKNIISYEDQLKILYIGRLEPIKGIRDLIEVITHNRISNITFFIAGKGSFENKIIFLSKNYPNVKYLGLVLHEKKKQLINSIDLVLIPSHSESYSLTFIEAISFGKPIVCYDLPVFENYIFPHGPCYISKLGDAKSLLDNIVRLYGNPNLIEKGSKLAVQTYQKIREDNKKRNYLRVIEEIKDN